MVVLHIHIYAMLSQQGGAQSILSHLCSEVQRAAPVPVPHCSHPSRTVLLCCRLRACTTRTVKRRRSTDAAVLQPLICSNMLASMSITPAPSCSCLADPAQHSTNRHKRNSPFICALVRF